MVLIFTPIFSFSATLPSGYTELEYIENHGTNYIDTRIVPHNSVLKIDLDFQITEVDDNNNVALVTAGINQGVVGGGIRIGVKNNTSVTPNAYYFYNIETGSNWNMFAPMTTSRNKILWTINGTAGTSIITGDLSDSITSISHFGNNKAWRNDSVQLLNGRNVVGDMYKNVTKLYRAKIYLDDVLVFDGVPVKRNADNKVGLYDTVSNAFFEPVNSVLDEKTYTQLEYVTTNHDAYIQTNLNVNDFDKVTAKASLVDNSGNIAYALFGSRMYLNNSETGKAFYFKTSWVSIPYATAIYGTSWMHSWNNFVSTEIPLNQMVNYDIKLADGNQLVKVNSTTIGQNTLSYGGIDISYLVPIFAHNYNGVIGNIPYLDCAGITFYLGDTVVANFIPARRNSDNVAGMYDTISDMFYPSTSNANFTSGPVLDVVAGPEVLTCGYTELEYLELQGEAYFNTNVYLSKDMDIEFETMLIQMGNEGRFGGARKISNEGGFLFVYNYQNSGINNVIVDFFGRNATGSTPNTSRWIVQNSGSDYVPETNKKYKLSIINKVGSFSVDGVSISTHTYVGNGESPNDVPLYIGATNSAGTVYTNGSNINWRFYHFSATGVADIVPVKRDCDNVLGLYNKTTGEFLEKIGSGTLVAGPEIAAPATIAIHWGDLSEPDASGMCVYGETFTAPSTAPTAPSGLKFLGWRPR